MKSGNFIELTFIVRGVLQVEYINVEHVSRIMRMDYKPFIGMLGQTYTRQITETSYKDLMNVIKLGGIKSNGTYFKSKNSDR